MNVMLTPNRVETFPRPEFYGTPAYFGKVEWFDVVDRETNALLDWTVSRVDGSEVVVSHPNQGVDPGLTSLNAAAELIHARRINEVRATSGVALATRQQEIRASGKAAQAEYRAKYGR